MNQKLSIITINLNNSEGLARTINSIAAQTFTEFEFILIDGGSTDGSIDVINQYENNISKWISEKDNGIYHAMNKGIGMSGGTYCLFLNSGDSLHNKETLKHVMSRNTDADILYGNMIIVDNNKKKRVGLMPSHIDAIQLINDTLWHPVSFIKRALFTKYGNYSETLKIAGDYEFFCRIFKSGKINSKHTGLIIADFYLDGFSSMQENQQILASERKAIQDKYFTDAEKNAAYTAFKKQSSLSARLQNKIQQFFARLA